MKKICILLSFFALAQVSITAQCNPDTVAPTVVAGSGLYVNILPPTQMIVLWTSDFLADASDNCTSQGDLQVAVRRAGTGSGFPVDSDGNPSLFVLFLCPDIAEGPITVELWARDAAGNTSVDSTFVVVQDNLGACEYGYSINSCAETESGHPIEDVLWTISALQSSALPNLSVADTGACFQSGIIPNPTGLIITPAKNDDPVNGVSTFDLVLINKHVLGLQALPSPYKWLAADANGSKSVTTFDIVELRKLILGIYTKLPNNNSWGFVPKSYVFPDPANPFQSGWPTADTLDGSGASDDFIGYKVGDVNGNAITNAQEISTQERSTSALLLDDALLRPGKTVRLPLRWSEAHTLAGLQFALKFDPEVLEIQRVIPARTLFPELPAFEQFYAQPERGLLTFSWDAPVAAAVPANEPFLYIEVKALQAAQLSQALQLNRERLRPEVYRLNGESIETRDIGLAFPAVANASQTVFFPPSPNPSRGPVNFPMVLNETAPVQLELYDLSGRLVYKVEQEQAAGLQRLEVAAAVFGRQAGVFFYRLRAGKLTSGGKLLRMPVN